MIKHSSKFFIECGIVLYLLMSLFLVSCGNKPHNNYADEEKKLTDSIVFANKNEDSLRVLISKFAETGNSYGEIISYRELGRIFRDKSRFIESIGIHKKGLEKAVEIKDTIQVVQALNNIATNYRRMGILDEAAVYHYQALSICDAYGDKESDVARKNRVISLNGIGNIHMTMQNYEKADSVLRQALAGEHSLGSDLGQAINYANLGSIFEAREQMDSALFYYHQSMRFNQQAHSELGIALCLGHFGRLYEKSGDLDSALIEYRHAYDISSSSNDVWHWLESCLSIARVNIAKGNLGIAANYLHKAEKAANEINSLEHIAEAYRLEYLVSLKTGNINKALDYYILSQQYSDSVNNEKNLVQMQNTRINYERELKKTEIGQMQKDFLIERAQRRTYAVGFTIIFIIACLIIALLVYINRLRSQKNKIIRQSEKMRATFFTNITHEFRTTLTVIQGAAQELIQDSEPESMTYQNATAILRHESRLLNLINQILDVAKMGSADVKSALWRHGDIVEFVKVLCDGLRSYAAEKGINIIYAPAEEPLEMDFIPDYVQKIICNLVSNAIKFSEKDATVYIVSRASVSQIQLIVCDTGIGMSPVQKENIFTPFYQASDNSINAGSGIGLSVVKIAVEKMGGQIEVHSAMGEGSIFIVTLPMARNESDVKTFDLAEYFKNDSFSKTEKACSCLPETNSDDNLQEDDVPRVLIIEDTTEVAPCMNGFELCKAIRKSELLNHIPVIMVTAKAAHEDRMRGLESGADAYIEKPFHADELNMRVENLLEQRRMLQNKYSKVTHEKATEEDDTSVITDPDKNFLTKVTDAVKSQISGGKIDYNLLASALCLSRAQLNRKIKAITGETTTNLILKIKISLAKNLLDNTDKSIIEIAMDCGMDSDSYFCTIFKKATGLTPLQYRNRNNAT